MTVISDPFTQLLWQKMRQRRTQSKKILRPQTLTEWTLLPLFAVVITINVPLF